MSCQCHFHSQVPVVSVQLVLNTLLRTPGQVLQGAGVESRPSAHLSAGCHTWAKHTAGELSGFPVSAIWPPPRVHHTPPSNQ